MSSVHWKSAQKPYAPPAAAAKDAYQPRRFARVPWQPLVGFWILFAVCAVPILAAKVPPILDYPGHLARIYVITHPGDVFLAHYFAVDWKIIPALALDMIIPAFTLFLDIFAAGKLFILLTIFLIASGTFAVNYALYREWQGPALCFLFIFNGVFWDGLLPYLFGIGVALWATAGWVALRNRAWLLRVVFSTLAVTALFLSHLAGVGLYLLAIFCYEVSRLRWTDWSWRKVGSDAAILIAPFLVILPLISANPTPHDLTSIHWGALDAKWIGPYLAVRSANLMLDALFVGFLVVFLGCLIFLKRLVIPRVAGLFLGLAVVTYLVVPDEFFDGSEIDIRLPAAFVFFAIGFVHWRLRGLLAGLVFNGLVAAVLAVRVAGVAVAWQAYGGMVSEYEASFAQIAPGSRVLVVADLTSDWRGSGNRVTISMDREAIGHVPALAAIERSSLVSEVFADPGNLVYGDVRFKAPYRDAIPSRFVPTVDRLAAELPNLGPGALTNAPSAQNDPLKNWPANYDYLYVQYANPGTQLQMPELMLLYQGSSFQLYKVQPLAQ